MKYEEPVYMDKEILAFLRAWPEVDGLKVDYRVLHDSGLVCEHEDLADGEIMLSRFGDRVKSVCHWQTYNFWLVPAFLDLLPLELLADRTPPADVFVREVLRMDWNSRDIRTYISSRMREMDGTIAMIRQPPRDLRSMLDALGEAIDRLVAVL